MTVRRDWTRAIEKVKREGRCRRCQSRTTLEAAHIIGREHDRPATRRRILVVCEDDIVPLCRTCHRAYDAHRLDLLAYLTLAEQGRAAGHVGLIRAVRRITCDRDIISTAEIERSIRAALTRGGSERDVSHLVAEWLGLSELSEGRT